MPFAPIAGKEEAKLLYIKGFDFVAISEQLSLKLDTVRQWAHRGKWARARAACDSLTEWSGPKLQDAVAARFISRTFAQADRVLSGIEAMSLPVTPKDMKDLTIALSSVSTTGRKALGLDDGPAQISVHFHGGGRLPVRQAQPVIDVAPVPPTLPANQSSA